MPYLISQGELLWLSVSPLVVLWDVAYVLLRPHTMPGGRIHKPFWVPHSIYGVVDRLYGIEGFQNGDGLVAAYALVNLVESLLYLWCASRIYRSGNTFQHQPGTTSRCIAIPHEHTVVLVIFAVSLTVVTKTMLYGLNEACSGFRNTRHNRRGEFIMFYVLPNIPWILSPAVIAHKSGRYILQRLEDNGQRLQLGKRK